MKLFARVAKFTANGDSAQARSESKRLVEVVYDEFVHAGAKLSDPDKAALKRLNEEASTLSD